MLDREDGILFKQEIRRLDKRTVAEQKDLENMEMLLDEEETTPTNRRSIFDIECENIKILSRW